MFLLPFFQAHVIEHFVTLVNAKWNDGVGKAHLEEQEPADSAVSIVERVDFFELHVKLCNIVKIQCAVCLVFLQQHRHLSGHICRFCRDNTAYNTGIFLIFAHNNFRILLRHETAF